MDFAFSLRVKATSVFIIKGAATMAFAYCYVYTLFSCIFKHKHRFVAASFSG